MITATGRLDQYWADELGCAPEALYHGGVTVCTPVHRDLPRWMGWLVPVECIVADTASPNTGVISISPGLAPVLHRALNAAAAPSTLLPPEGMGLANIVRDRLPTGYPKLHRIMLCDEETFVPHNTEQVSELPPDDVHAEWYRMHFDGPVFVVRNEYGSIVSWAAIKCKSPNVWEMAVATEAPYRNRGLARAVVSRATEVALEKGKIPLYLYEVSNTASAHVCRAVGYTNYGHELTCETGRVVRPRWQ